MGMMPARRAQHTKTTRRSPSLGILLLVLGSLALAAPAVAQSGPPADDTITLGGLPFPAFVEHLARAEQVDYEPQNPGLGVSVSYRGADTVATIYVYDRKLANVPADLRAPEIVREMDVALDELQQVVRAGRYKSAQVRRQYALGAPAQRILYNAAELSLEHTTSQLDSFIFITTQRGKFFKIRYTTRAHDGSTREAEHFALAIAPNPAR
jgi:hypothetical protein